jgi:hypothetical protein
MYIRLQNNTLLERLKEDGNTGLDLSPGNALSKDAADAIEKLFKELNSIPCPSCSGSGKSPDPYDGGECPCSGCKGTGIHPKVREAILRF